MTRGGNVLADDQSLFINRSHDELGSLLLQTHLWSRSLDFSSSPFFLSNTRVVIIFFTFIYLSNTLVLPDVPIEAITDASFAHHFHLHSIPRFFFFLTSLTYVTRILTACFFFRLQIRCRMDICSQLH